MVQTAICNKSLYLAMQIHYHSYLKKICTIFGLESYPFETRTVEEKKSRQCLLAPWTWMDLR